MATLQDQGNELPECRCPLASQSGWGLQLLITARVVAPLFTSTPTSMNKPPEDGRRSPALRGLLEEHHDQLREDHCWSDGWTDV